MSLIIGSFVHKPHSVDRFDLIAPASQPVAPHPEQVYYLPQPRIEHTFHPGQDTSGVHLYHLFGTRVFALGGPHWTSESLHVVSARVLADILDLRSGRDFLLKSPTCFPKKSCYSPPF